jgi:hypothetical protein
VNAPGPPPSFSGLDVGGAAWVARRPTPQPAATNDNVIRFDATRVERLGRTFVDCTQPAWRRSTRCANASAPSPAGAWSSSRQATMR